MFASDPNLSNSQPSSDDNATPVPTAPVTLPVDQPVDPPIPEPVQADDSNVAPTQSDASAQAPTVDPLPTPPTETDSAVEEVVKLGSDVQDLFAQNDQASADVPTQSTEPALPLSDTPSSSPTNDQRNPLDILEDLLNEREQEKAEEVKPVSTEPTQEELAKQKLMEEQEAQKQEQVRQQMQQEISTPEQQQRDQIRQQEIAKNQTNNPFEIKQLEWQK